MLDWEKMKWIHDFQLFLFDFDGLLVNTEHLHFQAYVNVLAERGYDLNWNFKRFCELAHLNATAVKEDLCSQFPDLGTIWETVYREKKQSYEGLVRSGKVELMPGVEALLKALEAAQIKRCVVTHSHFSHIELIRSQIAVLQTIPKWITREDYERPKPAPDCYLRAIELYGTKGDRIIGFEDSIRGLQSLQQTPSLPVLICPSHHPLLELALQGDAVHFESFEKIPDQFAG